jgi:hypothetical protein
VKLCKPVILIHPKTPSFCSPEAADTMLHWLHDHAVRSDLGKGTEHSQGMKHEDLNANTVSRSTIRTNMEIRRHKCVAAPVTQLSKSCKLNLDNEHEVSARAAIMALPQDTTVYPHCFRRTFTSEEWEQNRLSLNHFLVFFF